VGNGNATWQARLRDSVRPAPMSGPPSRLAYEAAPADRPPSRLAYEAAPADRPPSRLAYEAAPADRPRLRARARESGYGGLAVVERGQTLSPSEHGVGLWKM